MPMADGCRSTILCRLQTDRGKMIRTAQISDLEQITLIRTGVAENHLSVAQLASLGITNETIAADMTSGAVGAWVAEMNGRVVAFAMTDRRDGSLFALFVQPGCEGRGLGSALLAACEDDLRGRGFAIATLATGPETRAYRFYMARGWTPTGEMAGSFAVDAVLSKAL